MLRGASDFAVNGSNYSLTETCLAPATGGALCVHANWPREGLVVRGDALPLTLVQPWLPPTSGRRIFLRGEVTMDAQIRPRGNAWEGNVEVRSAEGGVRLRAS